MLVMVPWLVHAIGALAAAMHHGMARVWRWHKRRGVDANRIASWCFSIAIGAAGVTAFDLADVQVGVVVAAIASILGFCFLMRASDMEIRRHHEDLMQVIADTEREQARVRSHLDEPEADAKFAEEGGRLNIALQPVTAADIAPMHRPCGSMLYGQTPAPKWPVPMERLLPQAFDDLDHDLEGGDPFAAVEANRGSRIEDADVRRILGAVLATVKMGAGYNRTATGTMDHDEREDAFMAADRELGQAIACLGSLIEQLADKPSVRPAEAADSAAV
jgi:hypothetical protein